MKGVTVFGTRPETIRLSSVFDPESARSIMRAVLRHLGSPDPPIEPEPPSAFAARLAAVALAPHPTDSVQSVTGSSA